MEVGVGKSTIINAGQQREEMGSAIAVHYETKEKKCTYTHTRPFD